MPSLCCWSLTTSSRAGRGWRHRPFTRQEPGFLRDWEPELGFGPGVLAPGAELFSLPYSRVSLSILPLQAALRSQHLGLPSGSWGTWSKVYVSQPQFPQRLTEAQRPPASTPQGCCTGEGDDAAEGSHTASSLPSDKLPHGGDGSSAMTSKWPSRHCGPSMVAPAIISELSLCAKMPH